MVTGRKRPIPALSECAGVKVGIDLPLKPEPEPRTGKFRLK